MVPVPDEGVPLGMRADVSCLCRPHDQAVKPIIKMTINTPETKPTVFSRKLGHSEKTEMLSFDRLSEDGPPVARVPTTTLEEIFASETFAVNDVSRTAEGEIEDNNASSALGGAEIGFFL